MKTTTLLECCSPHLIVQYVLLILFCEALNDVLIILCLVLLTFGYKTIFDDLLALFLSSLTEICLWFMVNL